MRYSQCHSKFPQLNPTQKNQTPNWVLDKSLLVKITDFWPLKTVTVNFKGTQSAMWPRWPGHYFCQFEKSLPQPEIKWTRRLHLEIRFSLSVSFDPRYFTENLFLENFNSSFDIISYLVKNSIQRNMNRRGDKRAGAWREKLLSFTKITKQMYQ